MAPDKENATLSFTRRVLITTIVVILILSAVYLTYKLSSMLMVIFAGIMLSVLLKGLADLVTKVTGWHTRWALLFVIIGLLLIVGGSFWLIGPHVAEQVSNLGERIPEAMKSLKLQLQEYEWGKQIISNLPQPEQLFTWDAEVIRQVTGVFSSTLGIISSIFIILFLGIYLSVNPRIYLENLARLAPPAKRDRTREVLHFTGRALRWWLLGRIISMIVIGILTGIGYLIAGVPLALTLGLIAAALSFIPYIGPVLAFIPAMLVAFAESPLMILKALVVYLAVQILESYVITPLVQKRAVAIPPALLISFQVLMGVLAGAMGILLATPLLVVIIILVQTVYIEDILKDKVKIIGEH